MEFTILGPTGHTVGGQAVPLGTTKQRGLLAVLLYHVGESVRVESLVEFLWNDRPVRSCRPLLHTLASRLRSALRASQLSTALVRVPATGAYRLDIDPETVDYHRFQRLAAAARSAAEQGRREDCVALLTDAVQLWRDEPLADLHGARGELLRQEMQAKLLDAQKFLAENELAIGRHHHVLTRLDRLVLDNQLDEQLAWLWASALRAADRGQDARVFAAAFCRRYRHAIRADPVIDFSPFLSTSVADATKNGAAGGQVASLVAPPRQLPNDISDFSGHADLMSELDSIAQQKGASKVIVLTGMPGVGKSTLAAHWGHQRRDWFPDGQLYLNAMGNGRFPPVDIGEALGRLLIALGVPAERLPVDTDQRREEYHRRLAGRRALVVLDNVVDSDQARRLIPRSDTVLTVITSRDRLRGLTIRDGIRSRTLAPLPDSECRALLSQIIGANRVDGQPQALRELGRLAAGLPLALRVIGEHVVSRPRAPLADLADELATRLLDGENDDADEASLRSVFAWSLNGLAPLPRRVFRLLGLFPGVTVSVDAAAALVDTEVDQVGGALDRLAQAHLLNHDTVRRYRVHDLLRKFAVDLAHVEDTAELRRAALHRLLDWYLLTAVAAVRLVEPGRPPVPDLPVTGTARTTSFTTGTEAMRWCATERANLLAVVRAAMAEGLHRHAWQLVGILHEVLDRHGRQGDVLDMLRLAVEAATADGHEEGRIGSHINLGATYFAIRDNRRAGRLFHAALQLARQAGRADAELICLHNLAAINLRDGATASAVHIFERVLEACRQTGNPSGEASSLQHLGDAYQQIGQWERAVEYHRQALTVSERAGSLRGRSLGHVRLAALSLRADRPLDALAEARVSLDLHDRVADEALRCEALAVTAQAHSLLGQPHRAMGDAILAVAFGEESADPLQWSRALAVLAEILVQTGDPAGALARCREGNDVLGRARHPEEQAVRERFAAVEQSVADRVGRSRRRSA
ncbi:AfsR/SARP family transcriptional regulator [Micromonospora sp. SH-82]|uniref:AfsR/SARP family transcriptional regulator n=1 Tax=Micromonospora sp. SH-82 TaxID=3132938 RepID=UPI003EBAE093